ncbi:ABC-F family ATP-binding cassette domain-containing protein [Flindersiella endophytica]
MSFVRLAGIDKRFGRRPVLREVFLRLSAGDKVGLIGKNGAGKTTVLNLILGREQPDAGTVDITQGVTIGYFSQFSELDGQETIEEILSALFADIKAIEDELDDVARALERSADDALLHRQAALLERMDAVDGWTYQNRIDTVLSELGFHDVHRKLPVAQLSGGWRNRAALARILLQQPDVLLMDEPTNYLDLTGLRWLEQWFQQFRGALLVVSHDRHFLDMVVNRVIEVENFHLQEYDGGYSEYVRKKQLRLKTLERQFAHEEELLVYEQEALTERKLSRRLANIKKSVTPRPVDRIVTGIYQNLKVPGDLCWVEGIGKGYGGDPLFEDVSFSVHRGDRIAIVGPNGSGKTTLLDVLTGQETPDTGRIVWSKGARFAYYNQVLAELDPDDTVSHSVNALPPDSLAYAAPRKQVNRFLGLFRFSEMDLQQKLGTLSGGQQARVALAQCLLSGASVIILDEPTNHLDITSTQVMERALLHFPGAVILVSHDRFFIESTALRTLAFGRDGKIDQTGLGAQGTQ